MWQKRLTYSRQQAYAQVFKQNLKNEPSANWQHDCLKFRASELLMRSIHLSASIFGSRSDAKKSLKFQNFISRANTFFSLLLFHAQSVSGNTIKSKGKKHSDQRGSPSPVENRCIYVKCHLHRNISEFNQKRKEKKKIVYARTPFCSYKELLISGLYSFDAF